MQNKDCESSQDQSNEKVVDSLVTKQIFNAVIKSVERTTNNRVSLVECFDKKKQ